MTSTVYRPVVNAGWGVMTDGITPVGVGRGTVRRQATATPGGLVDEGTKGKRAREVPIIKEMRSLVLLVSTLSSRHRRGSSSTHGTDASAQPFYATRRRRTT